MMKKNIGGIIVFFLLSSLVLGQRGGGGGGGGRGGGGSSGGGGGGSRSSSSGNSKSCVETCKQNSAACIEQCKKNEMIAGAVIGGISGVIFLIAGVCFLYWKKCRGRKCINCCCLCPMCPCSKYQSLKKTYNVVEPGLMSLEEYNSKKQEIISTLNRLSSSKGFLILQSSSTIRAALNVEIVKQLQFLTEIKIVGDDSVGTWKAKGYILCREGSMFMWFYKIYDDLDSAGQTDQWQHLVYESTRMQYGELQGKWFYVGFENHQSYSGKWKTQGMKDGVSCENTMID